MTYAELITELEATRSDIDLAEVERAYEFAKAAHEGQTRYSGEPYIIHPVEATRILLQLNPDIAAIQACLLHDVTEDTERTAEEIEQNFGSDVACLVKGMEKLSLVRVPKEAQKVERWKKMFLSMAKDVRIVFIKLSDRLHNMRTLQHVPKEKQKRIALESLTVHAAIASRLGIYQLKGELEDLCFRYLHPDEHESLQTQLAQFQTENQDLMQQAQEKVEQLLLDQAVPVKAVNSRLKSVWSIHQKMLTKDTDELKDIYDLFAVRVILPDSSDPKDVSALYNVLGLLHSSFLPLQDRFKDYVAMPKPNGYRSLHTTVLGLGEDLHEAPTEIQIRSEAMHREAELGIASHWRYKSKSGRPLNAKRHKAMLEALEKMEALLKRRPDLEATTRQWVENFQEMKNVDRAKSEALLRENGIDQSDLDAITKGRSQANPRLGVNVEKQLAWLKGLGEFDGQTEMDLYPNKIFVLTPRHDIFELPQGATPIDFAYHIHSDVGNSMAHSKVNDRIVPLDHTLRNGDIVEIIRRRDARPKESWLSMAASNSTKAKIRAWFRSQTKEEAPQVEEKASSAPRVRPQKNKNSTENLSKQVLVTGEEDLPLVLSACCKPRPPMPIIGYVTRGRSIRIHRQNCAELSGLEGERFVSAHWKANEL